MKRRFDYIRYDDLATKKQEIFKALFERIEVAAHDLLDDGRPKDLFLNAIEEAYMWVGKSIRDEQIKRTSPPHEERRTTV